MEIEPETSAPTPSPTAAPAAASTPGVSFSALVDSGTVIPPDTEGTVGPNHLMETLNSDVLIQDKSGNTLVQTSIWSFWSSLGINEVFDPRIAFDPYGSRWIFSAGADSSSPTASILLGVSQTSDPTGGWNLYKTPADPKGKLWADFPTMGFNANWIVVQANMYSSKTGSFRRSNIWAFDKASLYAGGAGNYTLFKRASGFTQFPASTYDPAVQTEYLIESRSGATGKLRLSAITGPIGAEKLKTVGHPKSGSTWRGVAPILNFAPQLGSSEGVDTDDDRILSCVYRNGGVWASQTVYLPRNRVKRSAAQWWQVDTSEGNPGKTLQFGRIDDSTGNYYYAYPSIAVNQNDDALIGYTRFSAAEYASAGYAFRLGSDPPNTTEGDTLLKAGESAYFKDFGTGDNRWGDYSNTSVDPVNDTDLWTIQEYADAGGDWGTWWGEVMPTAAP